MPSAGPANRQVRDIRAMVVMAWVALAVGLGVFVSIPVFLLMVAISQIAAVVVRVTRENGNYEISWGMRRQPLQSAFTLVLGGVFLAFATAAFVKANTSLLGILLE